MADQATPESFTPTNFTHTPTTGQSVGMSDAQPRSDFAQRVMPTPQVTTPGVPNVAPGTPINPSAVVPNVAPETKPTVK